MTGEITLRGRVLAIGGLKEKAVAAHRNAVRHVLIPYQNMRDVEELPEEVQGGDHVPSGEDDGRSARAGARPRRARRRRADDRAELVDHVRAGARTAGHPIARVPRRDGERRRLASGTDAARGRVRGTVERRQVVAAQPARSPKEVRAREQHAGPHARDQLLQGQRPLRARRPPGLRLRARLEGTARRVEAAHRGLPAREPAAARDRRSCSTRGTTRPTTTCKMLDFLGEIGVPTIVVLTKIDKLTPAERKRPRVGAGRAARPRRRSDDSVQRRDRRGARRAGRGDRGAPRAAVVAGGSHETRRAARDRGRVRAGMRRPHRPRSPRRRRRLSGRRESRRIPARTSFPPASARSSKPTSRSCSSRRPAFASPRFPLDESVIRTLAPDSYRALHANLESQRAADPQRASMRGDSRRRACGMSGSTGWRPDARFVPTDVTVTSGGRDFRPFDVIPISARLRRRSDSSRARRRPGCCCSRSGVDVSQPIVVAMGAEQNIDWETTSFCGSSTPSARRCAREPPRSPAAEAVATAR